MAVPLSIRGYCIPCVLTTTGIHVVSDLHTADQVTGTEASGLSAAASGGTAGSLQAADAAASAATGSDSSSSTSPSTNTPIESSSRSRSTSRNGSPGERQNSRILQSMGLWVELGRFQQLPQDMQHRLTRLRQTTPALKHAPSGFMAVVNLNTLNLQTVVVPAMTYRTGHPLGATSTEQQQQHKAGSSKESSSAAAAAAATKDSSSAASVAATTAAAEQGQRRRQEPTRKGTRAAAAAASVLLSPESLVKENTGDLMVNLNTQMTNALAANEFVKVINLFDALLDQGIAAAQQKQQQQQQQEGAGEAAEQQQQQLVLPVQYKPDLAAAWTYSKALGR